MFFIAAKLFGALLAAETWLVVALAGVLFALLRQKHRTALRITIGTLLAVLALSIFPLGEPILARIESTYQTNPELDQVNGIIMLGGGGNREISQHWGQPELGEGGDRYTATLALARQYPEAIIVFTGGSGALRDALNTEISEGDLARKFFHAQGISEQRLIIEKQSRNTAENAKLSLNLVRPKPETHWVLVTSAFHMPRAMLSFKTAGWSNLTAYPVDFRTASFADHTGWNFERNLHNLNIVTRELVGQLAYRLKSL